MAPPDADCDVAIVGGGPAGLSAAARLKGRGIGSVIVFDREPQAGGVPRHCGHYPYGLREFHTLMKGPDYAWRVRKVAQEAGVDIRPGHTVVALAGGRRPKVTVSTNDGVCEIGARRILLATGIRERPRSARLIGGDRPLGVMSTGALQAMVYLEQKRPFERPVILGTELVSFSALFTCRHGGIRPQVMIEPNDRITAWQFSSLLPRLLGIPVLTGTRLTRILGGPRVEAVESRRANGVLETLSCDGVIVSGGFTPEATLARPAGLELDSGSGGPVIDQFGRTCDPAIFAAGNLLRPVETAGWSWAEGRRIADCIADDLTGRLPSPEDAVSISVSSPEIRFALPQRLSSGTFAHGLEHIQLRLAMPVRGVLEAHAADRLVWARRLNSRPERRILLPLNEIAEAADGRSVTLSISRRN